MYLNVAADELNFLVAAKFQIGSDRRTKVLRIIKRDFVSVNVEEKLRDGKARNLSAAGGGYLPSAESPLQLLDLRQLGIEKDCAFQVCQRKSLIAQQHRNRGLIHRSPARDTKIFIRAADIDSQHGHTRRENIR